MVKSDLVNGEQRTTRKQVKVLGEKQQQSEQGGSGGSGKLTLVVRGGRIDKPPQLQMMLNVCVALCPVTKCSKRW